MRYRGLENHKILTKMPILKNSPIDKVKNKNNINQNNFTSKLNDSDTITQQPSSSLIVSINKKFPFNNHKSDKP
eukprot:UN00769